MTDTTLGYNLWGRKGCLYHQGHFLHPNMGEFRDEDRVEQRMLIAHLKAKLVSGEAVDLLPVRHETDVKKEVSGLLEGWAKSGFLIREKFVYPWHQVQTIEVTVESISNAESGQKLQSLHGSDRARLQDEFWKGGRQI